MNNKFAWLLAIAFVWVGVVHALPDADSMAHRPAAKRSFKDAYQLGVGALLADSEVAYLEKHRRPDITSGSNFASNPSKTQSMVIETALAALTVTKGADERQRLRKIANVAAAYMLSTCEPTNSPLAGFTATYAGKGRHGAEEDGGQYMLSYPADAGSAFLTIYAETLAAKYLNAAKAIADTYLRLQGEDGAWPLKVNAADGKAVTKDRLVPTSVIRFLEAIYLLTGDERYRAAADRAFADIDNGLLKNWLGEGRSENRAPVEGRYRDFTKQNACETAIYLLKRFPGDQHRLAQARELLRHAERQFAAGEDSAELIRTYLALHAVEKNPLDLAKAKMLGVAIVNEQEDTGRIRTHRISEATDRGDWFCRTAVTLRALDELASAEVKPAEPVNVPELMARGTTRESWESSRRPELVKTFSERMYGIRPIEKPADLAFTEIAPPETVLGGKALRKRIRATYSGPNGCSSFDFSVWIPTARKRAPAFLHCSPRPAESAADPNGPRPVYLLPVERIVKRGYAAIAYCNREVAADWQYEPAEPTNGVFTVFGPKNLDQRGRNEWGILSAWAWGMSRVLDWVETEPRLDASRVAAVGLSRNGKTALIAGCFDQRFAMTVSCCSGEGGAKLKHIELPLSEHIRQIWIAHRWFAPEYGDYRNRDSETPFDQHQFLALAAPRLLYVSSAMDDAWAGQRGEFYSALLASPAWELYGQRGLIAPQGFPMADMPLHEGSVGYHIRTGPHAILPCDWDHYLDFADRHGWKED